ncbi:MAG: hypothetical protein IIB30_04005 [Chloroflexi bacterium]|nr:hypothetical protein [Chloroflexota bacterium]MCI0846100.1 hypothetical protein [Chloroflexota bacterium]
MLEISEARLEERLRQAEDAEGEIHRLQNLASAAPQLRLEKAKQDQQEERERSRRNSMDQARKEIEIALEMQTRVPALVEQAAAASDDLYRLLREIYSHRNEATESLAMADRVDYESELEEAEEHESALNRSTQGLAWALASRHGEARVRSLLEEMGPGFQYFRGCHLEGPLTRDLADFILKQAISPNGAGAQQDKQN